MTTQIFSQLSHALSDPLFTWRSQYPIFGQLLDEFAPRHKALRYLGISLWQDGLLADAADVLLAASDAEPNDPEILAELGCVMVEMGRRADALRYLQASLILNPNQAQTWLSAAGLCNETGDRDAAEKSFEMAREIEPDSAQAAIGLGLIYFNKNCFEDAARLLSQGLRAGSVSQAAFACLGQALFMLGDFHKSALAFETAARSFPEERGIIQKYALARMVDAAIHGSVVEAVEAYLATITGLSGGAVVDACRTAFQILIGYDYTDAAIRLGEVILKRNPGDRIVRYHLDALHGRAPERTPDDYLKACFDQYAPKFDQHLVGMLEYRVPEKLLPMLSDASLVFDSILDLGCGTGLAAPILSRLSSRLTGVDISPRMLGKASQCGLYESLVEEEAISYLTGGAHRFDLIVALDLVIYFGDLKHLLASAVGRLKPGGLLAFSYEICDDADFSFLRSGRFAHATKYIHAIATNQFHHLSSVRTELRREGRKAVLGEIIVLRKPTI